LFKVFVLIGVIGLFAVLPLMPGLQAWHIIGGYCGQVFFGHYFAIVEIFNRLFMVWYWVGGTLGLDYPLVEEGWQNVMWYESTDGYVYGANVINFSSSRMNHYEV
jgi:hypothetical protein